LSLARGDRPGLSTSTEDLPIVNNGSVLDVSVTREFPGLYPREGTRIGFCAARNEQFSYCRPAEPLVAFEEWTKRGAERSQTSDGERRNAMGVVKKIVYVIYPLGVWLSVTGCHTVRGAGEDIERGGEAIERAAE
jgi:entericidin B